MPTTPLEVYFPVLVQALIGVGQATVLVVVAWLLGHRTKNIAKDMPYECGVAPVGSAQERFSVKFYLVAMLFIVFDIEAVFLFPWVTVYRELRLFAFVEMFVFVAFILAGFFYMWKKGVLDWADTSLVSRRKAAEAARAERDLVGAGNRE
jgi:NADH-quinone oxidoreductase subunit A